MVVELIKLTEKNIPVIYHIQQSAFLPLLKKYQDYDTNPAMETEEIILHKLRRSGTTAYGFLVDGSIVGSVRIHECEDQSCRVSALCVLPEYQSRGIAREAMQKLESRYPDTKCWRLDTILQETGNCHLYEKLGYIQTGQRETAYDGMTLVDYKKHIPR